MQLRKRILSYFLLAIYLLVAMNHSVNDTHDAELNSNSVYHQHDDFKDVHHEHHFHVGIFHLLAHLFESIHHSNNHTDEHLVVIQKTTSEKIVDQYKATNFFTVGNEIVIFSVDAESLPDPPPFSLFLAHRLKHPCITPRAPPALV